MFVFKFEILHNHLIHKIKLLCLFIFNFILFLIMHLILRSLLIFDIFIFLENKSKNYL